MAILITGAAGFIGFHVAKTLLARGEIIIGVDNLNDYYDVSLKQARLNVLLSQDRFNFHKINIADKNGLDPIFDSENITRVIHLAAQPGVRFSLTNPNAYIESNIQGFMNILEACRHNNIEHLVYASSSSVYGSNARQPFSVSHSVDHPISLYAATKKSNELMAHSYAHLFKLPVTGLRFFTVYGPWGRPDMATFLFTKNIIEGTPIDIFNNGQHARDFTYIDDITAGIIKCLDNVAAPSPNWDAENPDLASSNAPYRLFNIGNNHPVQLMDFIACIEKEVGKKAIKNFKPLQKGDVLTTYADVSGLEQTINYRADTDIQTGIKSFVSWYRKFYKV